MSDSYLDNLPGFPIIREKPDTVIINSLEIQSLFPFLFHADFLLWYELSSAHGVHCGGGDPYAAACSEFFEK